MARRSWFPRNNTPTIDQQRMWIKILFPHFRYRRELGVPVWRGTLQPRDCSPEYRVKIEYRIGKHPRVWVTVPPIIENAPHLYRDGTLCLYYPKDHSWNERSWIAKTIVPWTAEWLLLYELWLETDKWWGLEAPHNSSESKNQRIRRSR